MVGSPVTRVAINAQVQVGASGGVAPFLGALVKALGALDDGADRYVLVGHSGIREWLESIRGDNQDILLTDARRWGCRRRNPRQGRAAAAGRL